MDPLLSLLTVQVEAPPGLVEQLFLGVAVPGGVSAALLLVLLRPWQPPASPEDGAGAAPFPVAVAIAAGFASGFAVLFGLPPLPPPETFLWLFWIAAVSAVPGEAALLTKDSAAARWIVRVVLSGFVVWASVRFKLTSDQWTAGGAVPWFLGLGGGLLILWSGIDAVAKRRPGATVPLVFLVTGTGTSLVLLLTGSAKLAQTAGILCACLGAAWVLGLWRSSFTMARGGSAVAVLILAALWMNAYFLGETTAIQILLLAASPLFAWVGETPAIRGKAPLPATLARLGAVSLPVLAAVALAFLGQDAAGSDPYDYGEYEESFNDPR